MKKFYFDDFMEVVALVNSRCFAIQRDGQSVTAMVPFADMLNHDFQAKTDWYYDEERQGLRIIAYDSIEKG